MPLEPRTLLTFFPERTVAEPSSEMQSTTRGLLVAALILLPSRLEAQQRFATSLIQVQQGGGGGLFDPPRMLGGPVGAGLGGGSLDVHSLGVGGSATLGFDLTLADGPGADLVVYENGFVVTPGQVYTEACLVEVSTNGVDFARFPTRYSGPAAQQSAFGSLPFGTFSGLVGGVPVLANVLTNTVDPLDPVVSGGEAFDLAELADHDLVQQGLVDLQEVHFVRLVDVLEGTVQDSSGSLIWDHGGTAGSADIDGVGVIQHAGEQAADRPRVDLWLDEAGFAHCVLADANGLADLDWSTLSMSVNLAPMPFQRLRDFFTLLSSSATELHLVSPVPIPGSTIRAVLAVSVRDQAGSFSGDQLSLHP